MSSKRYTEEFKVEAVRQVVERSHSVAEVASRLGMTTHRLSAIFGTNAWAGSLMRLSRLD